MFIVMLIYGYSTGSKYTVLIYKYIYIKCSYSVTSDLCHHQLYHYKQTTADFTVAMSSAMGLVGTGFASWYWLNPEQVFKSPVGRCKATTPSSLSLTSNRVTTNY